MCFVCVAGKRVKQTRGAGGTQVGAAGLVGEDRWALPFHDPRAICLGWRWPNPGDKEREERRKGEDCTTALENIQPVCTARPVAAALTDLAPAPVVNHTTVFLRLWYHASGAYITGGNKFGELDLSPARFNLHKPTSVSQHRVKWKDWPPSP